MWRTVCHSAIGRFHVETGLPCQDYGAYQALGKDVLIGAVADGAGSVKHSDLGAKLAVETAIQFIIDPVDGVMDDQKGRNQTLAEAGSVKTLSAIFERFFPILLIKVQQELHGVTKVSKVDFSDLATTLLVFIATSKWLVSMQIGDGFILVKPAGERYQLLFQPDKGEYINETTFVTSTNALAEMQIRVLAKPMEFICAATDGVEKVAINYVDWKPFSPFFQPLEQYLQTTPEPLEQDLKEFLEREDLNNRTTDDKTLLLALWDNNQ